MIDLALSDAPDRGAFEAIFQALDGASREVIGPANPRLLVIPIHDPGNTVIGGFWGVSLFRWLHVEMLLVPERLRGQGVGSAMMALAETEARSRDCIGMQVDVFSFQAVPFYEKIGFSRFGVLDDCPPGHQRLFLQKRLA